MQNFNDWYERNKNSLKCKPRSQKRSYEEFFEGEFKGEKIPEIERGEVYFAKLFHSSKIRPFVIYQNNYLNEAVHKGLYHSIIVLPLSGQILGGDYRFLIKKRDNMTKDSEIVTTAIGIISPGKIIFSKGLVTKLTEKELDEVDKITQKVLYGK